jgi:hypothetical protein
VVQFGTHVSNSRSWGRPSPQELEPKHLRVDGDLMIASTSGLPVVTEVVGLGRLLGQRPDGLLEDLAFAACHKGVP